MGSLNIESNVTVAYTFDSKKSESHISYFCAIGLDTIYTIIYINTSKTLWAMCDLAELDF